MAARNPARLDQLSPEEVADFKAQASMKSASAVRKGVPVIAKGDSWFDFLPGTDIIDCLRERHDYSIRNYSKAGDTLENMILGNSTDEEGRALPAGMSRALADVKQMKPGYFLFSGGGNDVAGNEFVSYLNHSKANAPSIVRSGIVEEMIDKVFKGYIEVLLERVREASERTVVVMHGYGHAIPSGRGTGFFGFTFTGPWLLPGLRMKGIEVDSGTVVVRNLIDRYNQMLAAVAAASGGTMRYVDLRPMFGPDDWRDELHLKNSAFARAADAIAGAMA